MDKYNHPSFPVVQPQTALQGEIDPVCGMTVDPQRAASTHVHAGRTYYFCSASCAATFQAAPDRYLGHSPPAATHTDPVCGMSVRPDHGSRSRADRFA